MAPHLAEPHRAPWLGPSAAFQREQDAQRPWIHDILWQYDEPREALEKWMRRDIGFADTVERHAPCLHHIGVD